jgi:hypothetical protein
VKPQPQTYAERLRGMMSWMLLGAGIACFGLAIGALLIAWVGGWPSGTEHQRLCIISWALLGALAGMLSVIVSLAIGGPVGRFNAKLSRSGLDVEASDKPDAVAIVTNTTGVRTPTTGTTP